METGIEAAAGRSIEHHSVDFIPLNERRGRPRDLFTLWFGANMVWVLVVSGGFFVAPHIGFGWAVLALVLGNVLGTVLSAYHAAQGPWLGVPQMIQSRVQFGYVGSVLPMLVAELVYIVFFAACPALVGLMAQSLFGMNPTLADVISSILMAVVALWGYRFAHVLGRYASILALVAFGILTVLMLVHSGIPHPSYASFHGGFSWPFFVSSVGLGFVFGAGYAPYVSDYTRYLPATVTVRSTAGWTYFAILISTVWLLFIGAYVTAAENFNYNTTGIIKTITDSFGGWFTWVFDLVAIVILIFQGSLALYAGANTGISMAGSLAQRPVGSRPSLRLRLAALVPVFAVSLAAGLLYTNNFDGDFTDALDVLILFLIPWSAINLADFYILGRRHYSTDDLFNPHGIYKGANIAGLVSFAVGFACAIPFANVGFYVGPAANAMGGANISWIVALVISFGCYMALAARRVTTRPPRQAIAEVAERGTQR